MATSGNFGKIKDLRITNLKIKGKKTVDEERNIIAKNINIDDGCVKNLKIADSLTVKGNITSGFTQPISVENLKIEGDLILSGNGKLNYMTSDPLTGGDYGTFTDRYGPMIQGVEKFVDYVAIYPVNNGAIVRNTSPVYYADITALDTSIRKLKADSKIKITASIFAEAFYNAVIIVQRFNEAGTFTGEVGTITSYPVQVNIGLCPWPYDLDTNSTANMVHFTIIDSDANSAEVYTYKIRFISNTASYNFVLNRTYNAPQSTAYEYGTSTIFLEEMESC